MNIHLFTFNLSALVLSACFACVKAKVDDSPQPGGNGSDGSGRLADIGDLKGLWSTSCFRAGSGLFGLDYQLRELKVDGSQFSMTVGAFGDEHCSKDSLKKLLIGSGEVKVGSPAKVIGAAEIDFDLKDVQLLALTDNAAALLNTSGGTCGKTDWSVGSVADVKDQNDCDYLYTLGIVPFDLISRNGETLQLGAYYESDDIGRSPDSRPSKIATEESYKHTNASIFENITLSEGDDTGGGQSGGTDNEPLPLTYAELSGSWIGTTGTITRGTSAPIAAQGVRFRFAASATNFSLNYGVCQNLISCSGGDAYSRLSGAVEDGALYVNCTASGVSTKTQVGRIDGVRIKILTMNSFTSNCPSGNEYVEIAKDEAGIYSMTAVADNYGEPIVGVAAITKSN